MMGRTRFLVIGIDSGDPRLIRQWSNAGQLPTFQRLFEEAAFGRIINPLGLEAGSCWPTFYNGVTPARHGQYDGIRYFDAGHYEDTKYTRDMIYPAPIWKVLSDAQKRIALIDAPYRFMSGTLNGIDVHDWGTHAPTGTTSFAHFKTEPPELAKDIEARFGLDPLKGAMCDKYRPRSLDEQRRFRDMLVGRATRKGQMSQHFLAQEDWDFFLAAFSECHCIGHHAWHIHDPSHLDHDPAIARALGDPMLDVYRAVDGALGSILDSAGPATPTVVYCSHGMGHRYSGTKLLDKILARLDGRRPAEVSGPLTRAMRSAWRSLPLGLRNGLKPTQAKLYKKIYHDGFQSDRAGRRFFEILANDRTAGVRINVVGREPDGIVRPGAEYDNVCRDLEEKLLRIVDAGTGLPLIREIHRSSEIYAGPRRDNLPDLLVTWNRTKGKLERISSPDIGEMQYENLSFRTGDHRPDGLFFAVGSAVRSRGEIGPVRVEDFAPTIADFFGLELPATDGKIIPVFSAEPGQEQRAARRIQSHP